MRTHRSSLWLAGVVPLLCAPTQAQTTTRVSVDSSAVEANGPSSLPAVSADGRYVAFYSVASNLVPGDTNATGDVFLHDRQTGQTTRVSVDSAGGQSNGNSGVPSLSADGRFVVFHSVATNLVPGDTNAVADVFVHDRQTGQTTRVSVDSSGAEGNATSYLAVVGPLISSDGRYVAFQSLATNLVPGDTNGVQAGFVHDCLTGPTARAWTPAACKPATGPAPIRRSPPTGGTWRSPARRSTSCPGTRTSPGTSSCTICRPARPHV